jgi:hypothetical protein
MAKFTYDEPTNRDDLTNVIVNISPTQTPIVTMIGTAKAKSTYHEFPEDELRDAEDNAHIEGSEDSVDDADARTRKGNYTQIMKQGYSVTETQQSVDTAGVDDEYGYNMLKAMKVLGKDLERAVTVQGAAVQGSKTAARKMAGIPGLIKTNVLDNAGATRVISKSIITESLQKPWDKGGEPKKLIVSSGNKINISSLTTSNTKNIDAKKKEMVEAIDVIDTDFGRVEIIASRFQTDSQIFVLDPQYLAIAWLRRFKKKDLPSTDDAIKGIIKGEMTLELKGEAGQALIKDLKLA